MKASLMLSFFSLSAIFPIALTEAQNSGRNATTSHVSSARLQAYLREPDGLEKVSSYVGDLVLSDTGCRWGEYDLPSLTEQSEVVLRGAIVKRTSYLTENGDSISTDYSVRVASTYKGQTPPDISITSNGGRVVFDSDHSATIHTDVWDFLQTGQTLVLFLRQAPTGYRITGNLQGVMLVTGLDPEVLVADRDTAHLVQLRKQVNGLPLVEVEEQIKAAVR